MRSMQSAWRLSSKMARRLRTETRRKKTQGAECPKADPSADLEARKKKVRSIIRILKRLYPEAGCTLDHRDPFQLYVSTVLSAQCTDERVNQVTPKLFKRFPSPEALAAAPLSEIEEIIRPTGFFRNKAKNIKAGARVIAEQFGGKMPRTMEELLKIPGTGRKTANVILGDGFGIPGIVVDTHVKRLSKRLGLTKHTDPVKIEADLCAVIPKSQWIAIGHLFMYHGRAVCTARKPACDHCALRKHCQAYAAGEVP